MAKFLILLMSNLLVASPQLISSGIHTCAIDESNQLYCWGCNDKGQVGIGSKVPTKKPELIKAKFSSLSVGRFTSCGIQVDGKIRCWGDNEDGQLGLGKTNKIIGQVPEESVDKLPFVDLGDTAKVVSLAAGQRHNCAIFDNGQVKCWGKNSFGELGLGRSETKIGNDAKHMGNALAFLDLGKNVKVKELALGDAFSCALLEEGQVKCWGKGNANGSGTGKDLGKLASEMGDNLKPVNLIQPAKKIVAGQNFACALLKNDKLYCWGTNDGSVFGNGLVEGTLNAQGQLIKTVIGNKPEHMGEALKPVELGSLRALDIDCGFNHCCAVLENQALRCWGGNENGQLGLGDKENRGTKLEKMGDNLPFVNLGAFAEVRKMTMGTVHTCVTLQDGKIRCWGRNSYAQMASLPISIGTSPEEMGDALPILELPKN